jgi:alanyl-tRNA synthetase
MQSHTAQHILSEAFLKLYKAQTVSVHFSDNSLTIDIDIPQLTWDIVKNIEHEANTLVMENQPIDIHWIQDEADLEQFPLRKPPQKKSKQGYRIVVVKDYDYSACGGMHVKRAGEIGVIKILKWHPTQRGIRLEYVCGWRALADYQWKNHLIIEDAKFFETKDTDLHQIIMKTAEDLKIVRHQLDQTQKELTPYRASALINSGTKHQDGIIISHIFQDTDIKTLRTLATRIVESEPHAIVLFASTGDQKKVHLLFNRDDKFHPTDLKMNDLLREVATKIGGKGGGKPNFAQGGGTTEGLTEAMNMIKKKVKKKLDIDPNG